MNDRRRPLRELLADAALYEEARAQAAPGNRWRARLLAVRFPQPGQNRLRPAAGLPPVMRLILMIAAPSAAILGIALAFALDLRPFASALDILARLDSVPSFVPAPATAGAAAPWISLRLLLWPLLVAASAGLTFLVRRRLPRILPLDW